MLKKMGFLCLGAATSCALAAFVEVASVQLTRAQDVSVTDCDRLAAEPDDPEHTVRGVTDEALNPAVAVPACENAVVQSPDNRRLLFQLARAYLKAGDLNAAFLRFRQAAQRGHVLSQTYLGTLYLEGSGVLKDETQAAVWFRKAADGGDNVAQFNLATLYETGRGVPKDMAQAVDWYRKSADSGFSLAQASLGRIYAAGLGVARDPSQAAEWYRKAADQGDESAQYRLAAMYADGQGVPKDPAQAMAWYRKAADKGYLDAADRLAALQAAQAAAPAAQEAPTAPTAAPAAQDAQAAPTAAPAQPAPAAASPAPQPAEPVEPPPAATASAQPAEPAATEAGGQARAGSQFFRIILAVVGAVVVAFAVLLFMSTRKRPLRVVERRLESLKAEAGIVDPVDQAASGEAPPAGTDPAAEASPFAAVLDAIPAQPTDPGNPEEKSAEDDATSVSEDAQPSASSGAAVHDDRAVTPITDVGETEPAPVAVKRCSQCQKEIPANDYFCCHCGALAIRFSDCQHDVRENARFCPRCGAILRWAAQKTDTRMAAASAAEN